MQWTAVGGFTRDGVEPWLPMGDAAARNVADQRTDPGSMLHLCRDLIALRRARPELGTGTYERLDAPAGVWAWRRGDSMQVFVNLSGEATTLLAPGRSRIAICTDRARDGERVKEDLSLGPWEAAVLRAARA